MVGAQGGPGPRAELDWRTPFSTGGASGAGCGNFVSTRPLLCSSAPKGQHCRSAAFHPCLSSASQISSVSDTSVTAHSPQCLCLG